MVGIIYYPSQFTSIALPLARQRQLAELALADFDPTTISAEAIATELNRYFF